MGSKKTTKQKVKRDPYQPAQPFIQNSISQTQDLQQNGPSQVAPFNPTINEGYDQTLNLSRNPDYSLTNAGSKLLGDTIAGDYIGANPYLDAAYNKAADRTGDRINGLFSGSGRYGSGANQRVIGDAMNNLGTDIYGGAYLRERQNQLNAARMAPGIDNSRRGMMFNDARNITGVGQAYRGLDAANRNEPYLRNQYFNNQALNFGQAGGTTDSTTVQKTGGLGPVVGGVLGGLNMAAQFMGGGPIPMPATAGGFGGGGNFGMIGNSMTPALSYNGPSGAGFYGGPVPVNYGSGPLSYNGPSGGGFYG